MVSFSLVTLTGCELMGYHKCDALSGWCESRKPAAIEFWDIKDQKPPTLEDYENKLADGRISVDDNKFRSDSMKYMSRKIDVFELCQLDWRLRDNRPLIESFKQQGFDCLQQNGLYRNTLSEDSRF